MLRKSWLLIVRCWLAALLALLLAPTASATCSPWLDKAWFNEFFFGTSGEFLELYSNDKNFPTAWQGWTLDIYTAANAKTPYTFNDNTAFACTKSGNKTWVTYPTTGLSGSNGLVLLKDASGAYVDAFVFDNAAPPVPWTNNTNNFFSTLTDATTGCPALASRLTAQAGTATRPSSQANMLIWDNQGNKDYGRMPDGLGYPWYVTSLTGAGTTYTICSSNNTNLTKTVNTSSAAPGGTVQFTLTLTNPGNQTANITVADVLPLGTLSSLPLTDVSVVSSNTADTVSYNNSTRTITWASSLASKGGRSVLTITASVPVGAAIGETYTNTARTTNFSPMQEDTATFTVAAPTTASFLVSSSTQTSCISPGATTVQQPVVTITAKDQANGTGNTLTGYAGTATLNTSSSTAKVRWQLVSGSGVLTETVGGTPVNPTYSYAYAFSPLDNGVASFRLSDTVAETVDVSVTDSVTAAPATMYGSFADIQFRPSCSPLPLLSVGNASVTEGNSGSTTLSFPVTLSAAYTAAITVNYTTVNGSATAGSDYLAASGTLTIPAGATSATIPVTVYGDTSYEADEIFTLSLSSPVYANLGVSSGTGTIVNDDTASALQRAHYRMDEDWTTSHAVLDSGTYAYHGTASGNALPAAGGFQPAYPNGTLMPSTCRYGSFDGGASSTIALPSGLSSLPITGTAGYTVMGWVRAGSATGARWLVGNNDASQGWRLTWNAGQLGLTKTGVTFTSATGGSVSGGSFAASTALSTGSWYFVALSVDTMAKYAVLYAYPATAGAVGYSVRVTATFAGTWTAPAGASTTSIGGTSGGAGNFVGGLDEVRVYDGPLSQAGIESARLDTRSPCPGMLDHLEIQGVATGVTCLPTTLTLRACADAACTTLYTGGVTGTLSAAGTPTVNWDGTSGGAAGADFVIPSGSSAVAKNVQVSTPGAVDFGVLGASPATTGVTTCNFGAPACRFTAADVGLIISGSATGDVANLPTQTAGVASSTYYLRAVQTSTTTGACQALLTGTQSVNWGYYCANPATCSASNLMTLSATSSGAIARNNASAATPSTSAIDMTFDVNGSAPFSLNFADVGSVRLFAAKTLTSAQGVSKALNTQSNAFVVKPAGFTVTNVLRTADGAANPAPSGPDNSAASVFVATGDGSVAANQFRAKLTAVTAGGAPTPNFGKEAVPEGIKLKPTRLAHPDLASNGALFVGATGGGLVNGPFNNGEATPTNLAWTEVGIMTLTPSVGDGDYLGAGEVVGTPSVNIGRFIPSYFVVTGSTAFDAGCSAGGFSYMGQPFATPLAATIEAHNSVNGITQNYSGAFGTGLVSFRLENANSGSEIANTRLTGQGTPAWSAGSYALTATGFARGAAVDGPFDQLAITARVDDANVPIGLRPYLRNRDADVTNTACTPDVPGPGTCTSVTLVTTKTRYGRARLLNANGSELLDLPMPLRLEYWDGSKWSRNSLDTCTSFTPANLAFAFGGAGNQLQACETWLPSLPSTAPSFTLGLKKPGAGNAGWTDITLNLGAAAMGNTCTASGASGPATTPASKPWLQYNWGNAADPNPTARATFGTMRSGKVILRRELY